VLLRRQFNKEDHVAGIDVFRGDRERRWCFCWCFVLAGVTDRGVSSDSGTATCGIRRSGGHLDSRNRRHKSESSFQTIRNGLFKAAFFLKNYCTLGGVGAWDASSFSLFFFSFFFFF